MIKISILIISFFYASMVHAQASVRLQVHLKPISHMELISSTPCIQQKDHIEKTFYFKFFQSGGYFLKLSPLNLNPYKTYFLKADDKLTHLEEGREYLIERSGFKNLDKKISILVTNSVLSECDYLNDSLLFSMEPL